MNPGIGMPEMLVVLVLALVIVGPQQLPILMRRVGRMLGQARSMAKEFQASFDEIGRDTELSELRKEIEALKQANPISEVRGEVDKAALEAQNQKIRDLKIKQAVENDRPATASPKLEKSQPQKAQAEKAQAEMAQAEKLHPEKPHPEKPHPEKVRSEKAHPEKAGAKSSVKPAPDKPALPVEEE